MPKPTPGTVIMATVATGEDTEATIDPMATMVTMARDLLMKPLPLAPTLTLQLTPGMDTMVMEDTEVTIVVTMARDLLMKLPLLNLAPTPTPKPTPGMDITVMVTGTGLTVMVTMVLDTVVTTGDKKWTSRTTSDPSLPTHL